MISVYKKKPWRKTRLEPKDKGKKLTGTTLENRRANLPGFPDHRPMSGSSIRRGHVSVGTFWTRRRHEQKNMPRGKIRCPLQEVGAGGCHNYTHAHRAHAVHADLSPTAIGGSFGHMGPTCNRIRQRELPKWYLVVAENKRHLQL